MTQPIAIVGLGGVFPGAHDLEAFWQDMLAGRSQAADVPAERWALPPDAVFDAAKGTADHVYSRRACLVRDFRFDPRGLRIEPELLAQLDPLFHLALTAARAAWEAGHTAGLDRRRVGVVMGNLILPSETSSRLAAAILGRTFEEAAGLTPRPADPVHPLNRFAAGLPGGIVAQALGLGGGAYTLDAACASSLYALKLAVDELRAGRMDAMLAGGVSRPDCLYTQMGFGQLRALSANGRSAPFDAAGDGLVVGEGAGMFLLKRLADAERDGDRIHAVIRGVGLSNDIDGSLLAPSNEGQLRAMRAAYTEAGWDPREVDLIECHATGTPLGDAVEVGSLKALWGDEGWTSGQCVLGSVKSNVGHLLTAAGSAGLIKLVHALRDGVLPPTAGFRQASPTLGLEQSPFRVLAQPAPWERVDGRPRRAASSAFGFGGINAHVLIEEYSPSALTSCSPFRGRSTELRSVPSAGKTSPARGEGAIEASSPISGEVAARPEGAPQVAIVGLATRFGGLETLREFQTAVLGGDVSPRHQLIAPTDRWWGVEKSAWFKAAGHDRKDFSAYMLSRLEIPAGAFRIPPRELEEMLPQQLLALLLAKEAMADAGLDPAERRPEMGAIVGIGLDPNTTNFHVRWEAPDALREAVGPALNANRTVGALGGMVASRVARELRLGGPSFTISSEETSGLRALEVAVRALQRGELQAALVGAVDLPGDPRAALTAAALRPTPAPGTQARPFEATSGGVRGGEGGVMLVLKRLEDAVAAGDRVYALVDGLGAGDYAGALRQAMAEAQAAHVGYVEGHGSGDPHEDDHEARALARVFPATDAPTTALGSVKASIGHTGAAAGLASVAKAALCLYQEMLPALPGFHEPQAALHGSALHVPQRPQFWLRDRLAGPRRAAVAAIGVDGGAAAAVLGAFEDLQRLPLATRERIARERVKPLGRLPEALFLLAGDGPDGLARQVRELERQATGDIEAIAARWPRPGAGSHRLTLVAANAQELRTRCAQALAHLEARPDQPLGEVGPIAYAPRPMGPDAQVAYVFPGSGAHYPGMGLELGAWFPEVLRAQDAATGTLAGQLRPAALAPWRLTWPTGWEAEVQAGLADQHQALLLGQVGFGAIAHDLVQRFGPRPAAVIGYCLGETAGFVATRTWADRDELFHRMADSPLFTRDLAGPCEAARKTWACLAHERVDWIMGLVDRPRGVVESALAGLARAYLLIVNAPTECVIGGDREAVEEAVARLGCTFREIPGVTSVHCEVVTAVGDSYRALHHHGTTPPAGVRFYSGAYGHSYDVTPDSAADAVLAQATGTFDYVRLVERAYDDGVRVFLEMGPRRSCTRMTKAILGERAHLALSVSGREHEVRTLFTGLGQLFVEGLEVDLNGLYADAATPAAGPMTAITLGGKPFAVTPQPQAATVTPQVQAAAPAPAYVAAQAAVPAPASVAAQAPVAAPVPVPLATPVAVRPAVEQPSRVEAVVDLRPMHAMAQATAAGAEAHDAFLRLSQRQIANQMAMLAHQQTLLAALAQGQPTLAYAQPVAPPAADAQPAPSAPPAGPKPFMDRAACLAYATGPVGPILGPQFAGADAYPTRVRLPDEPLMLVDRIMEVTGEPLSMTHGTVVTEHDVLPGAWYLDGGRIPTCIAVEAGQADLFLSGWLGIDFETKGLACYRLLDAVVTFHAPLPGPGTVIRYDIAVERFARQGDTWIFFFHFEARANGKPLISMTKGCAGFFTPEQLADGKGIVFTALDLAPMQGKGVPALLPLAAETYSETQLDRLRAGDLAGCFGPAFAGLPISQPARLPDGKMRLVHRITNIEPTGGRFGLGTIEGEADIHPDDWFITCHFVDDMVMPGTLMYECCCHTLRVLLFRMGWVGEHDQVVYEPVPGVASQLKCRGQVLASTKKVTYRITLKEVGYEADGTPYVLADALMLADGKPIVHIGNMSVRASGLKQAQLEAMWAPPPAAATSPARGEGAIEASSPISGEVPARAEGAPLYGPETILAYATGKPSQAFGDRYLPFDTDRVIARLPGPPYMFLDRVTEVTGEPWVMKAGAACVAHYDVPPDEWYFAEEGQPTMPFAVLLEIGLQPCGWLAGYVGSALTSDQDLSFRNLGGNFVQHRPVTPDAGTLTTAVTLTKVSQSGGMIIQEYALEVTNHGQPVYSGTTSFGFFTKQALAQQVGVRGAALYQPTQDELARAVPLSLTAGRMPIPGDMLRMNDGVEVYIPDGGPHGLGYVRGYKDVDPKEWFFAAHFYQDPVCPGSLGLEAMIQLMKQVAAQYHRGSFEVMPAGHAHGWIYRGQIVPTNQRAVVEAVIKRVEPNLIVADGLLCVDGLPIYQMTDFAVRIV